MKVSQVPLLRLLLCLIFVIGLVGATLPGPGGPGPYIATPPSDSCGASGSKQSASAVPARTRRPRPPCRRPRPRNP
ncbi:unnamed protein product [Microthlaspi erraticum]|uniref:Uncharacterized protein n=1 Tax=Microthlaspi erraticum TaxID=1685480 RepID=A0A6D2JNX0_9BRAS|nr:unnamed protein product [Microthlaspi erraticum]